MILSVVQLQDVVSFLSFFLFDSKIRGKWGGWVGGGEEGEGRS